MMRPIPKEFTHSVVEVNTVGELIKQLQRLPTTLPIAQGIWQGVGIEVNDTSNPKHPFVHFSDIEEEK